MGFEYDQAKNDTNYDKHGIDFEDAQLLWSDPKRIDFIARFSDELRLGLVAEHGDKLWTAIFTRRGNQIRIISVRRARDNEKALYNDSTGV